MKINKNWESLVWIIIGIVLLSVVILGLIEIVTYSKDIVTFYDDSSKINILENNSNNILEGLDITCVQEWDEFYLYKNPETKQFEVLTWSENSDFQYIDENWNKIDDINTFEWDIFIRTIFVEWEYSTPFYTWYCFKTNIEKYIKK